jgi:large subunit ribosomal protein L3
MKEIIGRKMGMTEVFAKDGTAYAVTVVEVLPNEVVQIKTIEKDGYAALQVGYEDEKESRLNKCEKGIYGKAKVGAKKHLVEVKGDEMTAYKVGDKLVATLFKAGDVVDVIGTSKGHGFSGTIKRYGHKIGPKGHGSGYHRAPGSFANNGRCNNRVIPGKKMAGHHGNLQSTILNLVVVEANAEKGYILIKGAIPGPRKGLVAIRSAVKVQKGKPEVIKELHVVPAEKKEAAPVEEAPVIKEEVKVETPVVEEAPKAEPAPEVKAEDKKGE